MAKPFKFFLGAIHSTLFAVRFFFRSLSWDRASNRKRPKSTNILVSGFFNETLGIGQAGQLVAHALEQSGFTVLREDLRPFDRGLLTRSPQAFSKGHTAEAWLIEANPPEARIALYTHDHSIWKHLYRIGFWHWESDLAPTHWVQLAPWFHEIWVSSRFSGDALASAMQQVGLADQINKIHVYPLPVHEVEEGRSHSTMSPVRVITLFDPRSHFERKNPEAVITAWIKAFPKPAQDVTLTIKALAHADSHPLFRRLQHLADGRSDIVFQAETLSETDTLALIAQNDILISLHRGEGFGLTLAEAMAAGVAVIATGWSGNMQFMTEENSIPVPYQLIPASKNYNGPAARWADPDIDAAASALKRLIETPDLRSRLGTQARQDISKLRNAWFAQKIYLPDPN